MKQNRPLLTIGIIFRDNIRCIEHCLQALQPLKDAVPCELIMADTGSVDGSREVAERYADVVFDFPWVNDFSAARNAVVDRARGKWFFSVDTDEYLDKNVDQLVAFLQTERPEMAVNVVQRNHDSYEMDGTYNDFMATRLVRMDLGVRYCGSIHEAWAFHLCKEQKELLIFVSPRTVLHHDGYVCTYQNTEEGKRKSQRNIELLKEEVRKQPRSLLRYLQMIESGADEPEFEGWIRKAVALVQEKPDNWERFAPPILRYAVMYAQTYEFPEFDEWANLMQESFPDSMFTRLDTTYFLLIQSWNNQDFSKCIPYGEKYLEAWKRYKVEGAALEQMSSQILTANPLYAEEVKILLSTAYCNKSQPEEALKYLNEVDYIVLDKEKVTRLVHCVQDIHATTELDTAPLIRAIWEGISQPKPSERRAGERVQAFIQAASEAIALRTLHSDPPGRPRSTLYLPLCGTCDIGTAAAVLETDDPLEMERLLASIQDWEHCSIRVLAYAIQGGMQFPLESHPMSQKELDVLAGRLASIDIPLCISQVLRLVPEEGTALCWRHALAEAAVCGFDWKDAGQGMRLARAYAQIERAFLPAKYGAENPDGGQISPFHRFGFYCARAFDALDAGDPAGYVRLLREGLSVCEGMKPMVEFLLEHTPELQVQPEPSAELKVLADQIRAVLANFSPDDPAVAALKQSEAYQKVAYLIEGIEAPVVGGLPS